MSRAALVCRELGCTGSHVIARLIFIAFKGGFPLSCKILRAFYELFTYVKNTHVNSFHCCVKSFCCATFFTYVYVRFRPTNALGPGLKTKRAGI